MDKRYQIFISSTFADLEDERKGIMEAIMGLDCFPAGMEMFPATDSEQFEYIKTIIDESDYYVLIVAGRYGSLAEDGISYTEKEFDYAKQKGVPILAFVKKDIDSIPTGKTDQDDKKRKKLNSFRKKALAGRMGNYWDNADELKFKIQNSLMKEFKTHPRTGWVKGDSVPNYVALEQLSELKDENYKLNNEIMKLKGPLNEKEENEQIKDKINKNIILEYDCDECSGGPFECSTTIKDIIIKTGLQLRNGIYLEYFKNSIVEKIISPKAGEDRDFELFDYFITNESIDEIQMKLLALGIVDITDGYDDVLIKFNKKGINIFIMNIDF